VDWLIGPDDEFAHDGMNSIRANHCVSLRARAVGKCQRDLSRALLQPSQFLVEMDDFLGTTAARASCKSARCIQRYGAPKRLSGMGSSRMTLPVFHSRFRCEYGLNEVSITLSRHRFGAALSSSWASSVCPRDSRKTWRLLVHAHIGADLAQRGRGGHSTDARAHNGNG